MEKESATALVQFINVAVSCGVPVPPAMWETMKPAMLLVQNVSNGVSAVEEKPVNNPDAPTSRAGMRR